MVSFLSLEQSLNYSFLILNSPFFTLLSPSVHLFLSLLSSADPLMVIANYKANIKISKTEECQMSDCDEKYEKDRLEISFSQKQEPSIFTWMVPFLESPKEVNLTTTHSESWFIEVNRKG